MFCSVLFCIFVIGGWCYLTLVLGPAFTKSHSFQTENVLLSFWKQITIILWTRICYDKHKLTFNEAI